MVYKISGEFTNENLPRFIEKIKDKYNIIYRNGNLYVALRSYSQNISTLQSPYDLAKQLKQSLQQEIFLPVEDFWIKDLFTQYNMNVKEDGFIKKWVEDNLVRIDKERIEIEKQKELRQTWNSLSEIEQALDDEIQKLFHRNKMNSGVNNKVNNEVNNEKEKSNKEIENNDND